MLISLDDYYLALEQKRRIKEKIKNIRQKCHKTYFKIHKKDILILDICFIVVILCNLGAVLITNTLVMKVVEGEPVKQLREANVVQAEMNNYVQHPDGNAMIYALLKQSVIWTGLIAAYLYNRRKVFTDEGYYLMAAFTLLYVVVSSSDFINDFGYLIGTWVFR